MSGALIRWADPERQRRSALGRHIARSMAPSMQAARTAGTILMAAGAWRRRPGLPVLAGWLRGLLLPHREA